MKIIILSLLLIIANGVFAQNKITIKGQVTGERNVPVAGVSITILNSGINSVSDSSGRYTLIGNQKEKITLVFSHMLYESREEELSAERAEATLDIVLRYRSTELDEVVINAETPVSKIKNQPLSVSVLETKNLSSKTMSNADAIGAVAGVNVRQNGGLGSEVIFSINGMTGKQIRFFLDGIPLEHYSSEMNIGSVPATFFSRFEIYKGSVPISLASDVLGGAVNMVSRDDIKNFMDLSYGIGSFNTHKLVTNARYFFKKNSYLSLNGFANHSDNNYRMDAEILDRDGNSYMGTVRRFHNKFSNYMVRPELGVKNTSWADNAFISFYMSGNNSEWQHDALARQPYGAAVSKNVSIGTLLRYKKDEVVKNLDVAAYVVANYAHPHLIDTSLNVYNWKGEVIATRNQGGEISSSGNDLYLKDKNISGQLNAAWHLSPHIDILGSFQHSYFHRTGADNVVAMYYGRDYYANPQSVDKTIGGLALKVNVLDNRFTSITSVKYFNFCAKGYSRNLSGFVQASSKKESFGFGEALSYKFTNSFSSKISYEYATRIPTIFELFGDQMLIMPNLSLSPETSHNLNLGLIYKHTKLNAQVNAFYRSTNDIIWQRPSSRYFMYQNLSKSSSAGIEGDLNYRLSNVLLLGLNATYQDIRSRSEVDGSERYFDKRIPNIPYLFGNADINYEYKKRLWNRLKMNLWYGMRYVQDFYLFWEGDGNRESKNIIPAQYSGNLGWSLTEQNGKYAVSFECQNLFNEKLYDNFRVQKPGRAFFLTLNYTIK